MAADLADEPGADQESALDLPRRRDPPRPSGAYPELSLAAPASAGGGADGGRATWSASSRASASSPWQTAVPSIPGTAIGPFLTQPLVVEAGGLDHAPTILATEESRVIVGAGDTAYADRSAAPTA